MDMSAKLLTMDDLELATLHANAERLIELGTAAQHSAAAELMPSIKAELGVRITAKSKQKLEALAAKRAEKPATVARKAATRRA
jgi:hypothetical protein